MRIVYVVSVVLLLLIMSGLVHAQSCSSQSLANGSQGSRSIIGVFNIGSGPALYASRTIWPSSGLPLSYVESWNGSSWGTIGALNGTVRAGAEFDDGQGTALYIGGSFSIADGVAAHGIAKWDGANWSALGAEAGSIVSAMTVFNDGAGSILYVAGGFMNAAGWVTSEILKWDGSGWLPVGTQTLWWVYPYPATILALTVHDDGGGPALFAGGQFSWMDSPIGSLVEVQNVAGFDGATWTPVGEGRPDMVYAFATFDDGTGPKLYAGGHHIPIASWDGANWNPVGTGAWHATYVGSMIVFDDGAGPHLFAGGWSGGVLGDGLARWDGTSWVSPALPGFTPSSPVGIGKMAIFDDGTGSALYVTDDTAGIVRVSCGSILSLTATQSGGPGAPAFVSNTNLTPGNEYYNLFSLDLCPSGPGSGWIAGLCISTPANLQFIQTQLSRPIGASPLPLFHFSATSSYTTWGPMLLPPVTMDAICFDFTGGVLGPVSPVTRITIQ